MEIMVWPPGTLTWHTKRVPCAIGRGGIIVAKKEGDGTTPAGSFPLRRVHYRPDRLAVPATGLAVRALKTEDGWCDDPADDAYNRLVTRPFKASLEILWRQDRVYDLIVELGHNDDPVKPGLGSAIFVHVATPDFSPTEGCIALALEDLLDLLGNCGEGDRLSVSPAPPLD